MKLKALAIAGLAAMALAACDSNDNGFEDAGDALEEAADDVGDAVDDAADEVDDAVNH